MRTSGQLTVTVRPNRSRDSACLLSHASGIEIMQGRRLSMTGGSDFLQWSRSVFSTGPWHTREVNRELTEANIILQWHPELSQSPYDAVCRAKRIRLVPLHEVSNPSLARLFRAGNNAGPVAHSTFESLIS